MRIFRLWAVVLFAMLAAACSKYSYETVDGDPLQTRIYTLDNGLKVYLSVNPEQPRIEADIAVRVGSKNDPSETTGLAHYFEHLMFKGTPHFGTSNYAAEAPLLEEIEALFEQYRRTTDEAERQAIYHRIDSVSYEASKYAIPNEYDKLMGVLGASGTNAYTSTDMTVYVEDIPSNQVENWARIEADRFMNPVIRGFHTELETVYEELNMSLTKDSEKVFNVLCAELYPHHPYGTQTVLGSQEHLKNPSITNIKRYHDTYYVPNNMAICMSGDFDPDEVIAIIDRYFGAMQPNPELPTLQFEPETTITEPIVRDVLGLEAENLVIGWRLAASSDPHSDVALMASQILYNGAAGLIDLDLLQKQQVLQADASTYLRPDYGMFILSARPKQGQSLETLRALLMGEVEKLQRGDFDVTLLEAAINNYKLDVMKMAEENESRTSMMIESFINGTPWKYTVEQLARMERITKEDIVAWASEELKPEACVVINKRQGVDPDVQKIAAPKITPIVTNRDLQSDFLVEIQQSQPAPIEPRFVDFDKDMSRFNLCDGVEVLYTHNALNGTFALTYLFNADKVTYPALGLATDYLSYLGTEEMTAEEIASEMNRLACSFEVSAGMNRCTLRISGLSENMERAVEIVEGLIAAPVADEEILANLKADMLKARADSKHKQSHCFRALNTYMQYGAEYVRNTTLTDAQLRAITSEELLSLIANLCTKEHDLLYYGPLSVDEVKHSLASLHRMQGDLEPLPFRFTPSQLTPANAVVLAPYDANQIYYFQLSNRGETFDPTQSAACTLYNGYFNGSMGSIVFQEMREARGLAYSAWAHLSLPAAADDTYLYRAFIATQNDKMRMAIEAFDEIINQMPRVEAAFDVAKESLLTNMRTQRTVRENILWQYVGHRNLGLTENSQPGIFAEMQTLTLDDVVATQERWVKGRPYLYGILGRAADLDMNYLRTLGPVKQVMLEEIFGY